MCCKVFWKRSLPFILTLSLSLLIVKGLSSSELINENQIVVSPSTKNSLKADRGEIGECPGYDGKSDNKIPKNSNLITKSYRICSKPRAAYTETARQNNVEGVVRVRVTFLASGQIGNIYVVRGLPDGLTKQAIYAAKQIKFQPQIRDGRPVDTSKVIEYSFSTY